MLVAALVTVFATLVPVFANAPDQKVGWPVVWLLSLLGGMAVVGPDTETRLFGLVGMDNVTRLAGDDRYETAADVAAYGVDEGGLGWNRVAIATGTNFPDALAGGVLQGKVRSVMLLTRPTALDSYTQAALVANKADITTVTFFGGTGALPQLVRDAVLAALE